MANPILIDDLRHIHNSIVGHASKLRNATVLVTGCGGFLGFYMMEYLVRYADNLGLERIIGLDSFLFGRPSWLEELQAESSGKLEVRAFDVSRDDLASVPGALTAEFVIHMASIASPTFYRERPLETVDANVWGLRGLLETYCKSEVLRRLLFFSSSEIYGDSDPNHIPTGEEYRGNVACIGPRACYDEAKRFGETLCYIFATAYRMPIVIARPFNNYGPGMRTDDARLPADLAKCVMAQQDIIILSDGLPTRTFCYVADAIAGYLLCLLHEDFDYFNIGIEEPEVSVRELARIYQEAGREILGYRGDIQYRESADPQYLIDNPQRRCPVITKARNKLGYRPVIRVEDGVRRYLRFLAYEGTLRP
ncbi:MAG: NAD-dependent epimerase/dehydratase family protein [Candidatus Binataceae bacterium]